MRTMIAAAVMAGLVWLGVTARQPSPQTSSAPAAPSGAVVLKILLGGTMPATVTIASGSTAEISAVGGATVRLKPTVENDTVVVEIAEVTSDRMAGTATLRSLTRLTLRARQAVHFDGAPFVLDLEWVGSTPAAAPTGPQAQQRAAPGTNGVIAGGVGPNGPCRRCCVMCGDYQICACAVESPCGNCCCGQCCESGTSATLGMACGSSVSRNEDVKRGIATWSFLDAVPRLSPPPAESTPA